MSTRVAPSASSRATSSSRSQPTGLTSRWTRFFTVFSDGSIFGYERDSVATGADVDHLTFDGTLSMRGEAAEDIRATTRGPEVPDTADPWFWYARGTFWRVFKYADELRAMIQP